jgi:sugar phosphate permease
MPAATTTTTNATATTVYRCRKGPTFPTNAVILGKWVSPKERSWANAMTEAGSPLGGLIAMGLSPIVCTTIGWQSTCGVFGVAVGLFTLLWQAKAASDPSTCTYVTKEELLELERDGVYDPSAQKPSSRGRLLQLPTLPLRVMLAPSALVVMSSHAIYNFGRYFLYFWMPSYFTEGLGLEPHIAGFYLVSLETPHCLALILLFFVCLFASFLCSFYLASLPLTTTARLFVGCCSQWFLDFNFLT